MHSRAKFLLPNWNIQQEDEMKNIDIGLIFKFIQRLVT